MNKDEHLDGANDTGVGPTPEVEKAFNVLDSASEATWQTFMEDLSSHAVQVVKKLERNGQFSNGYRPDAGGRTEPGKPKPWHDAVLHGFLKVKTGAWRWDPTEGRSNWWASKYPEWPPEMISLFGFLWFRVEKYIMTLATDAEYRLWDATSAAKEEETAAMSASDDDKPAAAAWDKETQGWDHTVGEFSEPFAQEFGLNPYECVLLKENSDAVLAEISRANYSDKALIQKIAELCMTERRSGDEWKEKKKREGYVQGKGAEPRHLVKEIFGREFIQDGSTDPLQTRIKKAKQKLQMILVSIQVEQCINAGPPEFAQVYRHLCSEAARDISPEMLSVSLARALKKDQTSIESVLKAFHAHWINWFERQRYVDDPGPPGPSHSLQPTNI